MRRGSQQAPRPGPHVRRAIAQNLSDSISGILASLETQIRQLELSDVSQSRETADDLPCFSEIRKEITSFARSAQPEAIDPGQAVREIIMRLESETDDGKPQTLRSALVRQEDQFGKISERRDRVDHIAENARRRVRRQRGIVEQFTEDSAGHDNAVRLLANMWNTLQLVTRYQRQLVIALDRNAP